MHKPNVAALPHDLHAIDATRALTHWLICAQVAKPLAAGDHVLLCEEHGGASTRPCTVVEII